MTAGARPGVSVVLSREAVSGSALYDLRAGDTVEIASTVQRSGRNLGFTNAEIRLASTGQVLCTGSHVKFLNNFALLGQLSLYVVGLASVQGRLRLLLEGSVVHHRHNHKDVGRTLCDTRK